MLRRTTITISMLPEIPLINLNPTVIMTAEKLADAIKQSRQSVKP